MEWLNEGVGLIVVVASVIIVVLLAVVISLLFVLRNKIAVQRLTFLGFFSTDHKTRERYADCTIGNRSLNEIALSEIGVSNGKVSFNLTELYKHKANLGHDARIVIEQRSSIRFSLTKSELLPLLIDGKHGKELKTLRLYAVDLTGNLYRGNIRSVRKLLAELMAEAEKAAENAPALPHAEPAALPAEPVLLPAEPDTATEVAAPAEPDTLPVEPAEAQTQEPAPEAAKETEAASEAAAQAAPEPTAAEAGTPEVPAQPGIVPEPVEAETPAEALVSAPTAEEIVPALPVPAEEAPQEEAPEKRPVE